MENNKTESGKQRIILHTRHKLSYGSRQVPSQARLISENDTEQERVYTAQGQCLSRVRGCCILCTMNRLVRQHNTTLCWMNIFASRQ